MKYSEIRNHFFTPDLVFSYKTSLFLLLHKVFQRNMTDTIPIYKDLTFYPNSQKAQTRYDHISEQFKANFNQEPEFYARAPGRVNLIGDHIDCSYFSSLPMSIEADVTAAVSVREDSTVKLVNLDEKYEDTSFELPKNDILTIDKAQFTWANYVKCGFLVGSKYLKEKGIVDTFKGLNAVYHGTVPTGGGLSSSAAISVCSALLFLRAHGLTEITKKDLTAITVVSEHYLGVNTGGLDQCASIYGEKNKALLVHYKPNLYGQIFQFPVIKPHDMVLLISNTLVEANKFETAPVNYNLRVVEFAVASEILAKKTGLTLSQDSNLSTGTLKGFIDTYCQTKLNWPQWDGQDIELGVKMFDKALELVDSLFTEEEKDGLTTEQAAKVLDVSVEDFSKRFLSKFEVRYEKLKLYKRAKHVYLDSLNVFKVLSLLQSNNSETFMDGLGKILNDSQQTSIANIENSTAEINSICEIAAKNGSYGSRVTGAGWGGSVVHVTTADKIDGLYKALTEEYYEKKFPGISKDELESALVITQPSAGASLVQLS